MPGRKRQNLTILGFDLAGDLAPFTTWTSENRQQRYMLKSPPKLPPSDDQLACRNAFRAAAAGWRGLTSSQRAAYERVSIRLRLVMTGYDLWVRCHVTGSWRDVDDAAAASGIPLHHP